MLNKPTTKRTINIIIVVMLIFNFITGCKISNNQDQVSQSSNGDITNNLDSNLNKTGFPIVKNKITLNITAAIQSIQTNYNDMVIFKNFEDKSNIDVVWNCIPNDFVIEKRNILMSSENLPDIFFKMNFSGVDVAKYSNQGAFLKINDLIEEYAPHIKNSFEKWPAVKSGLTMADGNIYSLGYISSSPAILSGAKVFFNADALKEVNKTVPTTLDELEDTLKALKEVDLNGNKLNDEIPLTTERFELIENVLKGSFGLGNRGSISTYVDIDPKTNDVRFIYSSDEYKALLQYVNKLFEQKLIDQDIFTMDLSKLISKGENGRALSFVFSNNTIIGSKYGDKSVGMTQPFKGPYGDQIWSPQQSVLSGIGAAIITSENKYPEASIRWLDYWYSEEGVREYFMGVKGETYEITPNGDCIYTDYVLKNPNGLHFERVLGKYVPWAGGGNPSIASDEYFKGGEMHPIAKASSELLSQYSPAVIWPQFVFDSESSEEMASIAKNLQLYINENRVLFVTGKKSFSEWDQYIDGFKQLKVDFFLKMYRKAISRYGY